MAGIDKIYGTQEQYVQFKNWLLKNQVPIKYSRLTSDGLKSEILPTECLYDEDWDGEITYRPIANFPEVVDKWLMKNCNLDFIQERLKQQYGE
jgi:hypothetical protein